MILIGLGTLLIVGSAISALQLYRYKKKQKTLYASVNPDYIGMCIGYCLISLLPVQTQN